jgi:hypothetical protein
MSFAGLLARTSLTRALMSSKMRFCGMGVSRSGKVYHSKHQ